MVIGEKQIYKIRILLHYHIACTYFIFVSSTVAVRARWRKITYRPPPPPTLKSVTNMPLVAVYHYDTDTDEHRNFIRLYRR